MVVDGKLISKPATPDDLPAFQFKIECAGRCAWVDFLKAIEKAFAHDVARPFYHLEDGQDLSSPVPAHCVQLWSRR